MKLLSCLGSGLRKNPGKIISKNLSPVDKAKNALTGSMKKTSSKRFGASKEAVAQTDKFSSQHKLGYKDKVTDGFTMSAVSDPTIAPKSVLKNKVHTSVNLKKDKSLKKWLESPEIAEFKKGPNIKAGATAQEQVLAERNYLKGISDFVNKTFGKVDDNATTQLYRDLKAKPATKTTHKLFSKKGEGLKFRLKGSEVPLGKNIEAGAGMCRHRALATKALFDHLGHNNMKAKLIGGQYNGINVQGQHAWNKIKMPSGNKFLFDASQNKLGHINPDNKAKMSKLYQPTTPNAHIEFRRKEAELANFLKENAGG